MNVSLKKQITKEFIQTVSDLAKINKLETFFGDLLGEKDFEKIVKKLAIAYWIIKKRDDQNIKNNLEVSEKEIAEIRGKLNLKGVKLALKYLTAEEWANVWSEKIKEITNLTK